MDPGSSLILCSSRPCYNAYPCHHFGNHPLATVRQDGQHGQVQRSGFPSARLGASKRIRKGEQGNAVLHIFLQNQCVETVSDAGIEKNWTVSLVVSYPYHRAGPQACGQALALNFAWKMECRKANDSTSRITQASARPWGFLMMSFQSRPFKHETNLRIQVCRVSTQLARARESIGFIETFNISRSFFLLLNMRHPICHLDLHSQKQTQQVLLYCNCFSSGV